MEFSKCFECEGLISMSQSLQQPICRCESWGLWLKNFKNCGYEFSYLKNWYLSASIEYILCFSKRGPGHQFTRHFELHVLFY